MGAVQGRVWQMSRRPATCRQVQSALERAEDALVLAKELEGHLWDAMHCLHANFVLQQCIRCLEVSQLQWILDEILQWGPDGTLAMAQHQFGCRVFERLLERCSAEHMEPLVDVTMQHIVHLSESQFGNFVLQHLMEYGTARQKSLIAKEVVNHASWMSTDWYASAVVNQCLAHGTSK